MSKKEDEAYAKWAEEVAGQLPDDKREAWKALTDADQLREVYRGSLREADYYTRLNRFNEEKKTHEETLSQKAKELESTKERINTWYQTESKKNQELLDAKERLEAQLQQVRKGSGDYMDDFDDSSRVPPMNTKELDELKARFKALDERQLRLDTQLPNFLSEYGDILVEAQSEGYAIKPSKLVQDVLQKGVGLRAAYEEQTKEARLKRAEEDLDKKIEVARKEAYEKAKTEMTNKLSSPDGLKPAGPSVLGQIASPTPKDFGADAALAEFLKGESSL